MKMGHGSVEYEDIVTGDGPCAEEGCVVSVQYELFLNRGEKVQSGVACSFRLGERRVIAGLEYGVEGMCAGGQRRLRVAPHLGYRDKGLPGLIPPHALLEFHVTLVAIVGTAGNAS